MRDKLESSHAKDGRRSHPKQLLRPSLRTSTKLRRNHGSFSRTIRGSGCSWPSAFARRACDVVSSAVDRSSDPMETMASGCGRTLLRTGSNLWKFVPAKLPERIVYLWTLDDPWDSDPVLMGTGPLLQLTHAIELTRPTAKLRIDMVTRGAQPVGRDMHAMMPAQAPAVGLLRVMCSEHSNFVCRAVDLPPSASPRDETLLWEELLRCDAEREIAFRGEARYARRLARGRPHEEQWLDSEVPLRLDSRERGHLDTLHFVPFQMPSCESRQVLIEVKAAGMNFRDVLKALALYPGEAPDARIFGDEVAGIVTAVGTEVTHIKPGDRVFGIAAFGLATHTLARAGDMRRIPANLSFDQAATLPVVFMTAWHALKNVARMRAGESILIHAGAGGVGMAAIQIAHHLKVEVIATAGSAMKRALLKTLGVKHVIDSRRADFAEAIMELTAGRGVDVILNSLAGEAIADGTFLPGGVWPLRRDRQARHLPEYAHSAVADATKCVVSRRGHGRGLQR